MRFVESWRIVLAVPMVSLCCLASPLADAVPAPPLRVLILSGLNNHDWRSTTPALTRMFQECGRFGVVESNESPGKLDSATFAKYDVVVSNWTPYPDTQRQWPPETEKAFLDFVDKGGGFVVVHAAACTFQVWPEFQRLIALTWEEGHSSHTKYSAFQVKIEDAAHPIVRGMPDFYTTDELYQNLVQVFPQELHVVCKAFSVKEKNGTDKFEPVLVCTQVGKGRGVNFVLGHDVQALQNVGGRTLLLRSAEWAATGEATIPIPDNMPVAAPDEK
jgi:type 1 glutamine amidotransferase